MTATTKGTSVLGLTAVAVLVISGCANPGNNPDSTPAPTLTQEFPSAPPATQETTPQVPAPATGSAEIHIKGFTYQGPETVSPGTDITVTNEDNEAHTITADIGAFDTTIKPGTGTFTAPAEPGTYPYHCTFHATMKGTLTVK